MRGLVIGTYKLTQADSSLEKVTNENEKHETSNPAGHTWPTNLSQSGDSQSEPWSSDVGLNPGVI